MAIIPNYISGGLKDVHPSFELFLGQLTSELQKSISNEGFMIPPQSTATINQLNTQQSVGALLYDSETNQLKVNINGTFKVIQTL